MHPHQLIFVFLALWAFTLSRLAYDEWQQRLRYGRRRRRSRRALRP